MIDHTLRYTLPAAYALLPAVMCSPQASAMLLAIGLQESRFLERRQMDGGPARGFWQFERGGILGVLQHNASATHLQHALEHLRYGRGRDVGFCHSLVEDNDTLACVFARLLLWTVPDALPTKDEPEVGWVQYREAWRPGKPHASTWRGNYTEAWARVEALEGLV